MPDQRGFRLERGDFATLGGVATVVGAGVVFALKRRRDAGTLTA